jgi:hypothetical protein
MKKTLDITIYLLIFIGSIMFLAFIWFRFIRERLPRNIAFNLSLLNFLLLQYICLMS